MKIAAHSFLIIAIPIVVLYLKSVGLVIALPAL